LRTILVASWKSGLGSLFHADAQKVADEISEIGDSATPKEILDKARDSNTELHKCFTWDNDVAAERWRLQQARQIVCCLVVKETEDEEAEGKPAIRMFYKTEHSEGYKPTAFILRDQDEYQKLLKRAYAEMKAFSEKYRTLSELETVFEAIDQVAG
jgi:hypothetical protein